MSKKTRVVRYTEEEFVTLLENIVNRVKREEAINESRERRQRPSKRNPRRRA
jgi:hypothetical protein